VAAPPRHILHVDMDAFFAAIVQRDRPELRGRPVLIGGDGPRSVVSTASYEARVFGCHSAMPMAQAKRLCPQAIIVGVPGEAIRVASAQVFGILEHYTPMVQPVSVDEAYLDVTGSARLLGDAVTIARKLKSEILTTLHLTASVGVAPNKFLAKLASDLNKPDGLTVIEPQRVQAILDPLPMGKIPGVGPAQSARLSKIGVKTIGDLRQTPRQLLGQWFGAEHADHLIRLANGQDDHPVADDREAKSIGQEQTFGVDVEDAHEVRGVLLQQCEQVGRRLRKHGVAAQTVTVKIRYGDFETITRAATLPEPTDLTDDLWHAGRAIFDRWASASFRPVRLIGITASKLTPAGQVQHSLFADPQREKKQALDRTLDTIAGKFGKRAIGRAGPDRKS
jgi:DNA polymerase-4